MREACEWGGGIQIALEPEESEGAADAEALLDDFGDGHAIV